jgi:hypothetical protein
VAQIVELITSSGGIIGSVLAIHGRIVATKKIMTGFRPSRRPMTPLQMPRQS